MRHPAELMLKAEKLFERHNQGKPAGLFRSMRPKDQLPWINAARKISSETI